MHLLRWWTWWDLWSFFKFAAPIAISIAALAIVLKDRKVQLILRERKGEWFILRKSNRGIVFEGLVEAYNLSSRANSIVNYRFRQKQQFGEWRELESEHHSVSAEGTEPRSFNVTPMVLAPYSGAETYVQAFTGLTRQPYEMTVEIQIEDMFGKFYCIEVGAKS